MTSRVESLPTGSQKHLWDLYKHVCCLVSYKNIFLVLTLVKRCVVGSCNNSNKTGHSTHFFFQKKKEFGASGSKLNVQTSYSLQNTIICGAHFAHECFEDDAMVKMGLKYKKSIWKVIPSPHFSPSDPKHYPKRAN